MKSDYNCDDVSGNDQWVKLVHFKKNVTKTSTSFDSSGAADGKQCQTLQHNQSNKANSKTTLKSKRLIFKNREKRASLSVIKEKSFDTKSFSVVRSHDEIFIKPSKIIEYNKDKNGYGLIAFDESEIPNQSSSVESGSDSLSDSICDNSSCDEDTVNDDQYSYAQYLHMWKNIENGERYQCLPLPSNNPDELNIDAVTDFVRHRENLKHERIRWHPDKMKNTLKKSKMLNAKNELKVTQVFQVINEAFELFH